MAYEISCWAADGPNGEYELRRMRINRVEETQAIIDAWSKVRACVRICRERSESPSYPVKLLWLRPGYKDPFVVTERFSEVSARRREEARERESSPPVTVPIFGGEDTPYSPAPPPPAPAPSYESGRGGDYGGGGASGSWDSGSSDSSSSSSSDSGSSGGGGSD